MNTTDIGAHGFPLNLKVIYDGDQIFELGLNTRNTDVPKELRSVIENRIGRACEDFFRGRFENELSEISSLAERESLRQRVYMTMGCDYHQRLAEKARQYFASNFLNLPTEILFSEVRERLIPYMIGEEEALSQSVSRAPESFGVNFVRNQDAAQRLRREIIKRSLEEETLQYSQTCYFSDFEDAHDFLRHLFSQESTLTFRAAVPSQKAIDVDYIIQDLRLFVEEDEDTLVAEYEEARKERVAERAFRELMDEPVTEKKIRAKKPTRPSKRPGRKKTNTRKAAPSGRTSMPRPQSSNQTQEIPARPLVQKIIGSGHNPYHYHQRVLRWRLSSQGVRGFVDLDPNGERIQQYKRCTEEQLEWARCCHYLPGMELPLLDSAIPKFRYSIPTDRGVGYLAKLQKNGEATPRQGMIYLGIDKENQVIYHMMFHELSFVNLAKSVRSLIADPDLSPFQEDRQAATPLEIEEASSNPWHIVRSYAAEVDEKGIATFTYPDKKILLYPIGSR